MSFTILFLFSWNRGLFHCTTVLLDGKRMQHAREVLAHKIGHPDTSLGGETIAAPKSVYARGRGTKILVQF